MSRKPASKSGSNPQTGVQTTGHEWDGIEEWDNPMPRWWLWTLYATILWAVIYTILFPAWPLITKATPGLLGWSTRGNVAAEIQRFDDANAPIRARLVAADMTTVGEDAELMSFANNAGAAVFRSYCSQCHGSGAAGVQAGGFPNLLDDDWLWGGTVEDILLTVTHGIRNTTDPDARYSQMPAFGKDELLEKGQIDAVVQFVMSLTNAADDPALVEEGRQVFADNCASCHGETGQGDRAQGAPNLTDAIWLYGGDKAALTNTVANAHFGVMPAWGQRLSEADVRSVVLYVHGLGGGE